MIEKLREDVKLSVVKPSKCSPYIEVKLNTPLEDYLEMDLLGFCPKCPGRKVLAHGVNVFLFGVIGINVVFPDAPQVICDRCDGYTKLPPTTAAQLHDTTDFLLQRLGSLNKKSLITSLDQICQLLKVS